MSRPLLPPEVICSSKCPSFPACAGSGYLVLGPGRRVLPQWRQPLYYARRLASAVRSRVGLRQPGDLRGVEGSWVQIYSLTTSAFPRRSLLQPDPISARSAAAAEGPCISLLVSRPSCGGQEDLRTRQAPCECGYHRACGPWQDHPDRGHHEK